MRHVFASAFLFGALACYASTQDTRQPVTLVLQFDGERSDEAIDAMKREFETIMISAGLSFDYKLRSELDDAGPIAHLILVRFKGRCRMETMPALFDERGPYAVTHVSDGDVLPFGEVGCDRVRVSIRSNMNGNQLKRANYHLGRALGRVLAHEVYHMLAKTRVHGTKGIAKTSLSAHELLCERLEFDHQDVEKIREAGM